MYFAQGIEFEKSGLELRYFLMSVMRKKTCAQIMGNIWPLLTQT